MNTMVEEDTSHMLHPEVIRTGEFVCHTEILQVCVLGYTIIGLALFISVQARDVFPQLLLARLLFSVGGAATSTMVTAILPSMIAPRENSNGTSLLNEPHVASNHHDFPASISSELTVTPQRLHQQSSLEMPPHESSPARLAGLVGMLASCGALLALLVFLRLPEVLQRGGTRSGQALADSYYIVGALSLVLAFLCLFGLRNLHGEDGKGWRTLMYGGADDSRSKQSSMKSLADAVALGFKNTSLGLGYLGGFVARASVRILNVFLSFTGKPSSWPIILWLNPGILPSKQKLTTRSLVGCDYTLHPPIRERVLYFHWTMR